MKEKPGQSFGIALSGSILISIVASFLANSSFDAKKDVAFLITFSLIFGVFLMSNKWFSRKTKVVSTVIFGLLGCSYLLFQSKDSMAISIVAVIWGTSLMCIIFGWMDFPSRDYLNKRDKGDL